MQQTLSGQQNREVIRTVSEDQEQIIKWIIEMYCPDGIELDPTYSKGCFYKNIPKPKYKFDINPQTSDTIKADCINLPITHETIKSIMFDPPFIVGIPTKNAKNGIMEKRFGSYSNIQKDLWGMYHRALIEFYRILKTDGILIVKCQDIVSCGLQFLSHIEIINKALSIGFYPKDIFVLTANYRLNRWPKKKQQHARKFHSYFIVFIKRKCPVKYSKH